MANSVKPGTYVTFRQKSQWLNHWIRLNTSDLELAQAWAEIYWPNDYSMIYAQTQFDPRFFPAGEKEYIEQPQLVG